MFTRTCLLTACFTIMPLTGRAEERLATMILSTGQHIRCDTAIAGGCTNDEVFVSDAGRVDAFKEALANGRLANEGFSRCLDYVKGWLNYADKKTRLIPRNLKADKDIWNAKDCAADNYPFYGSDCSNH